MFKHQMMTNLQESEENHAGVNIALNLHCTDKIMRDSRTETSPSETEVTLSGQSRTVIFSRLIQMNGRIISGHLNRAAPHEHASVWATIQEPPMQMSGQHDIIAGNKTLMLLEQVLMILLPVHTPVTIPRGSAWRLLLPVWLHRSETQVHNLYKTRTKSN